MNESPRVDAWIVQALRGDAGAGGLFDPAAQVGVDARVSGVWSERIPQGEALPAIRFSDLSPSDVSGVAGMRILVVGVYLVAAVIDVEDYEPLIAVADRIDEVLHRATGEFDGVIIESCIRQSPFRQAEDSGDEHHRHLGGIYRIQASA